MPVITLRQLSAASNTSNTGVPVLYIVGFILAGAIVLGLSLWLIIRFYRKRSATRATVDREDDDESVKKNDVFNHQVDNANAFGHQRPARLQNAFSRQNITSKIILPSKVLLRPSRIDDSSSGTPQHQTNLSSNRLSFLPVPTRPFSGSSFFSIRSSISSTFSRLSSPDNKVRQLFTQLLPDELSVTPGERLMVLQSFDDGWCVVGRTHGVAGSCLSNNNNNNNNNNHLNVKKLQGQEGGDSNVELGMVPHWCFLKPMKGVKTERPMRGTSLGACDDGDAGRNDLISWSNF